MLQTMTPATTAWNVGALEIHTLADQEMDERKERFFEGVERLIGKEGEELHKAEVLRRYAVQLRHAGEFALADIARQLGDTYEATIRQYR